MRLLLGGVGLVLVALTLTGPYAICFAPLVWPVAGWLVWRAVRR